MSMQPHSLFFRAYRAALKGDAKAARFLVLAAREQLLRRNSLPGGLARFLVRQIDDPTKFARLMTKPVKKKKGRPSIDDGALYKNFDSFVRQVFFGQKKSEQNAIMLAYLSSVGHPINEAGTKKESASEIVAKLTDRSVRSVQNDYYQHRPRLSGSESELELGRTYIEFKKEMKALRKKN
ncbi:hypothetical protein [Congregibacter litoralis]|uniref:Uncharacterized protein n=1 Tax=Congregibacter litoralis KT71 TaxID=314285 RepID=A4AB12_9GAMM|nr:hypothetical protein [Congregibacter litoralis]EAQ96884.1 hypothetical protein KT71_11304 [Congregibacter litoralis KT71]